MSLAIYLMRSSRPPDSDRLSGCYPDPADTRHSSAAGADARERLGGPWVLWCRPQSLCNHLALLRVRLGLCVGNAAWWVWRG